MCVREAPCRDHTAPTRTFSLTSSDDIIGGSRRSLPGKHLAVMSSVETEVATSLCSTWNDCCGGRRCVCELLRRVITSPHTHRCLCVCVTVGIVFGCVCVCVCVLRWELCVCGVYYCVNCLVVHNTTHMLHINTKYTH